MLDVIMLSVIMLSVIMQSVIMLSVMANFQPWPNVMKLFKSLIYECSQ
jgi:hypothetical protein